MLPGIFQITHKDPSSIYRITEDPGAGSRSVAPGKLRIDTVLFLHINADFPQASPGAIQPIHILHGLRGKRIHDKRPLSIFLQFGFIADRRYAGIVVTFLKAGLLPHH